MGNFTSRLYNEEGFISKEVTAGRRFDFSGLCYHQGCSTRSTPKRH